MRRGHRSRSAAELGMRLGDWASGNGERGEDLQSASPLFWLEWPAGSQEMPNEVGDKPIS